MVTRNYNPTVDGRRVFLGTQVGNYGDIIPANSVFAGGFFGIQEIADIRLVIDDPKLVDVDYNYWQPNSYLGSWQIFQDLGIIDINGNPIYEYGGTNQIDYQGFLTGIRAKITRTSYHSIGDTTRQPRLNGVSHIDNCNFFTIGATIQVGPLTLTGELQEADEDIYITRDYITPPPLQDKPYPALLGAIGLYLSPGVSFFSAQWIAAAINILTIDTELEPNYQCRVPVIVDCEQELADYLAANPGTFGLLEDCETQFGNGNCRLENIQLSQACGTATVFVQNI